MADKTNDTPPFVTTLNHAASDPFRLLVEAVSDYGIFMVDVGGHVSSWNPGAAQIKGYNAEEIIGQHISCFYTPEDVAQGKPQQGLQIALDQGRFEEEGLRLRKGGESFWGIITITAIHDAFGQHVGYANVTRDITERKQTEEKLRLRDRAIESFMQGVIITDPTQPDNPITYVNDSFVRLTGYTREEVIGTNCRFLGGPETSQAALNLIRSAIQAGRPCSVELLNYRKDGTAFWNALSLSPLYDQAGRLTHFVGVQTDMSSFKQMEQQFHQAQKMEAVGQLAGGVAHDFNNLLTIIFGYSELLLDTLPATDPTWAVVKAINEAGVRAAGLTRQLLFFSRQAMLETKVLNINTVVQETEKLLRRIVGEDIVLTMILEQNLGFSKIDPGQIGQVLMNLAINARDAMPQGGKLNIESSSIYLDEAYTAVHGDCTPGHYIQLVVSDNGSGMTPQVQARIFEPFFTTKPPGKGTGLGLATVYGIIKQSGGCIDISSAPGHGTTFRVYLPTVAEQLHPTAPDNHATEVRGGDEAILVVEDDDAVRAIAVLALQNQGYTVLQAEDSKKALQIIAKHRRGSVALLVTDVVMPGMSGRELAEALCLQDPDLKVLYLSGYTDDAILRNGILQMEVAFLQKPYTPLTLARKVREVLDKR